MKVTVFDEKISEWGKPEIEPHKVDVELPKDIKVLRCLVRPDRLVLVEFKDKPAVWGVIEEIKETSLCIKTGLGVGECFLGIICRFDEDSIKAIHKKTMFDAIRVIAKYEKRIEKAKAVLSSE